MKKWITTLILLLLAALIVLAIFLLRPEPTVLPTYGFFTYTINNEKVTIKDCDPAASGNIIIPDLIAGYPVVTIGRYAFEGCTDIVSVMFPDTTTEIEMSAFENCTSLTSVILSKSIQTIDISAFNACPKLTEFWVDQANPYFSSDSFGVLFNKNKTTLLRAPVALPNHYSIPATVTSIGDCAFLKCLNLTHISLPDRVTALGKQAFYGCANLSSIDLPISVGTIGYDAFRSCSILQKVNYTGAKEDWQNIIIKSGNNTLLEATITYNYCQHRWGAGSVTREPTCKDAGVRTYICILCEAPKVEPIPKLSAHSWNSGVMTTAPTCSAPGVTTFTCSVCQSTYTEQIQQLQYHNWNNGAVTKEPTCSENGTITYSCKVCNETKIGIIEMLPSHTPGDPATETEDQICTVCGKVLMPATGEPTNEDVGFFAAIANFFQSITKYFEDLFASFFKILGIG